MSIAKIVCNTAQHFLCNAHSMWWGGSTRPPPPTMAWVQQRSSLPIVGQMTVTTMLHQPNTQETTSQHRMTKEQRQSWDGYAGQDLWKNTLKLMLNNQFYLCKDLQLHPLFLSSMQVDLQFKGSPGTPPISCGLSSVCSDFHLPWDSWCNPHIGQRGNSRVLAHNVWWLCKSQGRHECWGWKYYAPSIHFPPWQSQASSFMSLCCCCLSLCPSSSLMQLPLIHLGCLSCHPFITLMPPFHWRLHVLFHHRPFLLLPPLVPLVCSGW